MCWCCAVQVTGLAVSSRHPYMFSCSLDKEVKCWDLEHNKVGVVCVVCGCVWGGVPGRLVQRAGVQGRAENCA